MSVLTKPSPPPPSLAAPVTDDLGVPPVRAKRRRALRIALLTVALVVVGALVAVSAYATAVANSVTANLQHADLMPADDSALAAGGPRPAKAPDNKAVDYVLIGAGDRASDDRGRSGGLHVLHLAGDRRSAHLVSIPGDLWVSIPGQGKNTINSAYDLGGPQLTVRTLEKLLGTRMDHAALIDYDGFAELTDDLGGVTVENQEPSVSEGYRFPAGKVTLEGREALAYVRDRGLPDGAEDRAERQRAVAQALLAKGLSRETVTNPQKFLSFTKGAAKNLTVDSGLTNGELRDTALSLRLGADDISPVQAPSSGSTTAPDGRRVSRTGDQFAELAAAIKDDNLVDYAEKYPNG